MRMLLAVLLLAAASGAATGPVPKAVSMDEKTGLLHWHLAYPAEVAAIPALAARIRAAALKEKAELLSDARTDRAERKQGGWPFNAYESSTDYRVAGNAPRLLSLSADWYSFTGGAHPNHGTSGLIWDRQARAPVAVNALFVQGAEALRPLFAKAFCKALDKERAKRREGEPIDGGTDDPFNACPKFSEIGIIPETKRHPGRLDTLLFHADPYVAGPYAEGDYDVELPVTAAVIAALKPEYRASFAAQRQ